MGIKRKSMSKSKSNFNFKSSCVRLDLDMSGPHDMQKTSVFLQNIGGFVVSTRTEVRARVRVKGKRE